MSLSCILLVFITGCFSLSSLFLIYSHSCIYLCSHIHVGNTHSPLSVQRRLTTHAGATLVSCWCSTPSPRLLFLIRYHRHSPYVLLLVTPLQALTDSSPITHCSSLASTTTYLMHRAVGEDLVCAVLTFCCCWFLFLH